VFRKGSIELVLLRALSTRREVSAAKELFPLEPAGHSDSLRYFSKWKPEMGEDRSGIRNQHNGKDDSRFPPVGSFSRDLVERSTVSVERADWAS